MFSKVSLLAFLVALVVVADAQIVVSSTASADSSSSTGGEDSSSSSTGAAPPAPTPVLIAPTPSAGGVLTTLMAGFQKTDNASTLLIDHGVATPNQHFMVNTEYYTVIYFWLLPTATANVTFNATVVSKLAIRSGTKNQPVHVGGTGMAELFLRYIGCPTNPETFTNRWPIKAVITIPGYDDISLNWQKQCSVAPIIIIPSKGMSGFETFCLVVFILTLLFCIAGCCYNFISRGRSGAQIIPCWSYIERYLCCKGEKRYSPRMDYDQPIGDDDSYGASYQADL